MKDFAAISANTTGAYPDVLAQDESAPLAGDGTEWKAELLNEWFGVNQAVLSAAYLTPNGTTEAAGASQILTALQTLFRTTAGVQRGMEISNNVSDATNDLDIAAGVALSAISPYKVLVGGAMTKRADASWAAGTNSGGRASATNLTGAKTFHTFAIMNAAGNVDYGFDTSLTAANLLADAVGYTEYVRIASLVWTGTAWRQFLQYGDRFFLKTPIESRASTNPLPTSAENTTLDIPTGLPFLGIFMVDVEESSSGSSDVYAIISNSDLGDIAPSTTVYDIHFASYSASGNNTTTEMTRPVNTSAQITTRFSGLLSDGNYAIVTRGWIDRRGK